MEKRHPNHPGEMSTDAHLAERDREPEELSARARAIKVLQDAGVPFLVGGAYAYATYTGIYRDTKDLDLFPRPKDAPRALEILASDGWRTERTDEVWLYKGFKGEFFVDLIFSSGNGIATVDDLWFEHARTGVVMGQEVSIAPPEEMIWSKGFVLERERYDGSDVNHLLRCAGPEMDWDRLLFRFERYWEVLLSHLMLFRYAYPSERAVIPDWVMVELMQKTLESVRDGNWEQKICRGNLLSRVNYQIDINAWGFENGRKWDETERGKESKGAEGQHEAPGRGVR
jgi:hypothetical protein